MTPLFPDLGAPAPAGKVAGANAPLAEGSFRWTPGRKDRVLDQLRHATPSERAALLASYDLTEAEVRSWEARASRHGRKGLAVTRLQALR